MSQYPIQFIVVQSIELNGQRSGLWNCPRKKLVVGVWLSSGATGKSDYKLKPPQLTGVILFERTLLWTDTPRGTLKWQALWLFWGTGRNSQTWENSIHSLQTHQRKVRSQPRLRWYWHSKHVLIWLTHTILDSMNWLRPFWTLGPDISPSWMAMSLILEDNRDMASINQQLDGSPVYTLSQISLCVNTLSVQSGCQANCRAAPLFSGTRHYSRVRRMYLYAPWVHCLLCT